MSALITALSLENPISIANFFNPIEELITDQVFTNEELIIISQQTSNDDKEQEEAEDVAVISITKIFFKVGQIKFLMVVTFFLKE